MLEIRIREDSRQRLSSFFATGHTGWAESGKDIVCAAASTLLQAAWLGLEQHAGVAVEASRESGHLELRWPHDSRQRADVRAIVTTTALSLEHIAAQYPGHMRIVREREARQDDR